MKELLTIKEFALFSGVEKTTLRYWDEIGLFSPARRGSDNKYRYYLPEQIITVNFIKILSNLNFPLKEIGEAQDKRSPEYIFDIIEEQEHILNMELRRIQECYSVIHTRKKLISEGIKHRGAPSVSIVHENELRYNLGPVNEFADDKEMFYKPFMKFCSNADMYRINLNFPIGGYHESIDSFFTLPSQPERFFSFDPLGSQVWKEGDYLTGFTRGYYGVYNELCEEMKNYSKEHGLILTGPVYEIYLHDELCLNDPSDYMVKISVAVS